MFEYLNWLTVNKRPWDQLSDAEKKGFNVFAFYIFLSKLVDYIELVNETQDKALTPQQVYEIYYSILPKKRINTKFPTKVKSVVPAELIVIIADYFKESQLHALEYCEMLGIDELKAILTELATTKKEITKLTKWKK